MHPFLAQPGPVGFAHRGAHGPGAGENSDLAFQRAVDLGFRHLETDVQVTRDGVAVLLHDPVLDRTTDGHGPVASWRWADVAALEVRGGGRVPRLADLLADHPDAWVNLDLKSEAAADAVVPLLRDRLDRVCVGSFDGARVARLLARVGRGLCTALDAGGVRAMVGASRLPGDASLVAARALVRNVRGRVAQVPVRHRGTVVVTPAFVRTCHAAGLDVHVWTVDDPDEQHRLLDLGVDGLMTDDASGLAGTLAARGAWPPRGVPGAPAAPPPPPVVVAGDEDAVVATRGTHDDATEQP